MLTSDATVVFGFRAIAHDVSGLTTGVALPCFQSGNVAPLWVPIDTIMSLAVSTCTAIALCWVHIDLASVRVLVEAAMSLAFAVEPAQSAVGRLIRFFSSWMGVSASRVLA